MGVDGELEGRHGIWNAAVVEDEDDDDDDDNDEDEVVVDAEDGDVDGGFVEEWLLLT